MLKKIGLTIFGLIFMVGIASAEKTIIVTLIDEEYKAMSVLTSTPEEWINNAAKNKARAMIDELVNKYLDRKLEKITLQEKYDIINSLDLEKEKQSRQ